MPVIPMPAHRGAAEPKRPVVLFIEDNVTQLDLYAMVLEEHARVSTATRGEDGYDAACQEHPDVIVTDVVLTGDDDAYRRAQLVKSELTGVLAKPCSADRLLLAVRTAVERR